MKKKPYFSLAELLWNFWCLISIVGIWPRFIEPNLVKTTKLRLTLDKLPKSLNGLKILQISDLHLNPHIRDCFLESVILKAKKFAPDIIVFTGDFLCYGRVEEDQRLQQFLSKFEAPHGCFAIFGNHDYDKFVSINDKGEYDVIESSKSTLSRGFKRLFSTIRLAFKTTDSVKEIKLNEKLLSLLRQTPFKLLHNRTQIVKIGDEEINLCGLGEYSAGQCDPKKAFEEYDRNLPGIVLSHNPDSISLLKNYPGELILSGHTHGGQINFPWLWKKFTLLENMNLIRGLHQINDKYLYINRGLGSVMHFRWNAMPEILCLTLESPHA